MLLPYDCEDLAEAAARPSGVTPSSPGCEECLRAGHTWVHLRLCLTCGHVGCCDSSPNKHASKHSLGSKHPVVRSFEPGEDWAYCFPHDAFTDRFPVIESELAPMHYKARVRGRR